MDILLTDKLYEQVARRVMNLIAAKTFKPGDKLYSLRTLCRSMGVSMSTAVEAYRLLEDQGIIESHPQSGYYVREISSPSAPICDPQSAARVSPAKVNVDGLMISLLLDARDENRVQFGGAVPNPALLPIRQISAAAAEVLREGADYAQYYDVPPGLSALRVQIARRLGAMNCSISPEEIVTTNGCQEAIYLALRVTCKPGDCVALESPSYFGYYQIIQSLGLRALEIPTHSMEGIIVEALDDALDQHNVSAVLLESTCSNPMGISYSEQKRSDLYEVIRNRRIPLVEDDIHGDLYYGLDRPRPVKSLDTEGLVLLCSSFSKTLAPSYRVGWAAPGQYLEELKREKSGLNISSASLPQAAIARFLERGRYDQHLRRIRSVYARLTREMTAATLDCFPDGTLVRRATGGFVLWVEMPQTVDATKLTQWAHEHAITVAPGYLFSSRPRYRHAIRINVAYWSPETAPALEALGAEAKRLSRG